MKKSNNQIKIIFLASIILAFSLATVAYPSITPVLGANTSSFDVSLTIDNSAPTITGVLASADSPAEGTTKIVSLYFNASDTNGPSDIPAANAKMAINYSGTTHTSGECAVIGTTGNQNEYECNVTIDYYDSSGTWDVNASVFDGASAYVEDLTQDFTMGTTYAISLLKATLTFNGAPGENDVNASNNPQIVNNTGNYAFSDLSLTAYGLEAGSTVIGAGNFAANTTDDPNGHALINNSAVSLDDSVVSIQGTKNIFVYIDIPSGIENATYTASDSWIVTAS